MPLLDFALGVMTFAYSGLLAVFVTALFTKRGSNRSVLAALAVGFGTTFVLNFWNMLWGNDYFAPLRENVPQSLAALPQSIAWPWHLVAGFSLALATCLFDKGPQSSSSVD